MLPKNYIPSIAEVQKYHNIWRSNPLYQAEDLAVRVLFRGNNSYYAKNDTLEKILVKVASLDNFYATKIPRIFDLACNIFKIKDLDKRLADADITLVDQIKVNTYINPKGQRVTRNEYSFATKFCSAHNPEKFPIFDSYVKKVLWNLKEMYSDVFSFKSKNPLRNYQEYKTALDELMNHWGLNLNYKELDRYLWLLGKQFFP